MLRSLWILSLLLGGGLPVRALSPDAEEAEAPMPLMGSTPTFHYSRMGLTNGYYVVQSAANTGFSFMVSGNFLGLVLNSAPVDDKTRLSMLAQYPFYMDALYTDRMTTNYPDTTRTYEAPFEALEAEGLSLRQDDLASPYIRVRATNPDGSVDEFSVNRDLVDRLLGEPGWDLTNLAAALRSYPFRLPDPARVSFRNLTRQQLFDLAEDTPGVARQEFVQTRRIYRQPQHEQAMSNAAFVAAATEAVVPDAWTPAAPDPVQRAANIDAAPTPEKTPYATPETAPTTRSSAGRRVALFSLLAAALAAAFLLGSRAGRR